MRTYLIDSEKNETVVDLTKTIVHSSKLVEFEFCAMEDGTEKSKEKIMVRELAGNYFSSFDGLSWKKMAPQYMPKKILNVDTVYDVYRGYKPSGLGGGEDGDLVTQMPGKIVKVLVEPGQEVKKGDTVLILEAMKMENEIKSNCDGVVSNIYAKEGEAVENGFLMMEIS